jgi:flagellar hook-associated protein 2
LIFKGGTIVAYILLSLTIDDQVAKFGHVSEPYMETDYLNAMGVGAGFDTKKIVTTLVAADKASKQSAIDRRTTAVDASISGMAQLKSSLKTLQTAFQKVDDKRDFNFSALSNSAPEQVYANFDASTSVPGTYKVNVSQLAQNDVIKTSSYSSKTADQNSSVAASVTIQVGSGTVETVTLASGSATLNDLVTGINALTADVTARVVETSIGVYRVVVEGPQGASNSLTITDAVFGLATSSNKIQTAQDSTVSVNGLSVSRSTNEVDDLVPGLKLDLMAITTADVVLSVSRDTSVAKAAITNLVTAYNAFEGIIKGLTGIGGDLKADSSIRAIREKVKDYLTVDSSTPGTSMASFNDIGITLQKDGLFKVDSAALGAALTTYYDDITLMFSANTNDQSSYGTDSRGLAGDIVNQITGYLAYDGIVVTRDAGYLVTKASLATEQTALDKKMAGVEERYTKQFSTMSKIMDEMKSTQKYLESQLDNLPFTSKNN